MIPRWRTPDSHQGKLLSHSFHVTSQQRLSLGSRQHEGTAMTAGRGSGTPATLVTISGSDNGWVRSCLAPVLPLEKAVNASGKGQIWFGTHSYTSTASWWSSQVITTQTKPSFCSSSLNNVEYFLSRFVLLHRVSNLNIFQHTHPHINAPLRCTWRSLVLLDCTHSLSLNLL